MKKINIKQILISFVIGGFVFAPASYLIANALLEAKDVTFDKTNVTQYGATKENVQEAIDELYDLTMAKKTQYENPQHTYSNGEIVYFNPVANTKCTISDYSTSNSATNYKSNGCMRWFAYLDDGGDKVKLLLDHNTTGAVQWYTSNSYVTYENSRAKQEIDNLVSTSGSNWKVSSSDDTIAIKSIGFIDANDIARVTGKTNASSTWDSTNSSNWFYFDTNTQNAPDSKNANKGMYWWLYDRTFNCTSYGCVTADSGSYTNASSGATGINNYGYWTSTNVGTSGSYVWFVDNFAYLNLDGASRADRGVRPVITILRSKL